MRKIFARFPLLSKDGRLRTSRRRRRDQYSEFVYSLGPGTSTFRAGNSPSHGGGKESSCSVRQIHPAISENVVTILSLSRAPRRLHRARSESYVRAKRSSAFYRVITECLFEEPDFHDDPELKSLRECENARKMRVGIFSELIWTLFCTSCGAYELRVFV